MSKIVDFEGFKNRKENERQLFRSEEMSEYATKLWSALGELVPKGNLDDELYNDRIVQLQLLDAGRFLELIDDIDLNNLVKFIGDEPEYAKAILKEFDRRVIIGAE